MTDLQDLPDPAGQGGPVSVDVGAIADWQDRSSLTKASPSASDAHLLGPQP